MYVCGVTPYDVTHLGHASTFVWVDVASRVLRHIGHEVILTRNVTDVDDVLTAAARRAGQPYDEFAAIQQYRMDHDVAALSVRRPDHEPRAHRHVAGVMKLAQALLDNGSAYERGGSVWFRGEQVLARTNLTREQAVELCAAFGETMQDKDDPLDAPVWRASDASDPAWQSPWGMGRPGWHAECAAMVLETYGPSIDIHAGGADLAFPHHVYEAAMAESAYGVAPFSRSWMHVGTVHVDGAKMAKSTGNLVLVNDILQIHRASALRWLIVNRAWADSWEYSAALLDEAEHDVDALFAAAGRPMASQGATDAINAALLNDLDVPTAAGIALEAGGDAARTLLAVLGIS